MSANAFSRILFALGPTGTYCREDRCQSYFHFELIPSMRPPLEECQGAAGAIRAGAKTCVIDAPAEKLSEAQFFSRVGEFNPDLIVLAATYGSLDDDLALASRIKQRFPALSIGVRGAPCYSMAQKILAEAPQIDMCFKGDYELVFEDIVHRGLNADGLVYRDIHGQPIESPVPRAAHLDDLPLPDRSGINQRLYTVRGSTKPQATIHVQRGCSFPCSFCLVHSVTGSSAKHRSPEHVVKEIKLLQSEGINHFYLRAETFSLDKRWAISVCEALKKSCPGIRWVTATRVECVDHELLQGMRESGCYGISFGVDVASREIGEKVKKIPRIDLAEKAMRLCDRHGIISLAYIMIGFLWDTADTVREAEQFMRKIRPDLLTVHFAHPYPGTPYYDQVVAAGQRVVSRKAQSTPAHSSGQLSIADLNAAAKRMLLSHYSRPSVLWSLVRKRILASRLSTVRNNRLVTPELVRRPINSFTWK